MKKGLLSCRAIALGVLSLTLLGAPLGSAYAENEKNGVMEGVVVEVNGQRAAIQDKSGKVTWVSLIKAEQNMDASLIGKKISGKATRIGDAIAITEPAISQ